MLEITCHLSDLDSMSSMLGLIGICNTVPKSMGSTGRKILLLNNSKLKSKPESNVEGGLCIEE